MNKNEQRFYDSFLNYSCNGRKPYKEWLEYGVVIGPYKVDFLFDKRFVIEIDGHDYHKTKEQRDYDYKRERYLMKNGYFVIRFTGTEVFLEPEKCLEDLYLISDQIYEKEHIDFKDGFDFAKATPSVEELLEAIKSGGEKDA